MRQQWYIQKLRDRYWQRKKVFSIYWLFKRCVILLKNLIIGISSSRAYLANIVKALTIGVGVRYFEFYLAFVAVEIWPWPKILNGGHLQTLIRHAGSFQIHVNATWWGRAHSCLVDYLAQVIHTWKKLSQKILLHFPFGMGTYDHQASIRGCFLSRKKFPLWI